MNYKFPYVIDWNRAKGNENHKLNLSTHADPKLTPLEQEPAKNEFRPKIGKTKEELAIIITAVLKARKVSNIMGYKAEKMAL